MTVTITAQDLRLDRLREAQLEWLEAEFDARAAFALLRLDRLDKLGLRLTTEDRFDAAYAIWDDFIDGRRADERGEPLVTPRLTQQASIFARCAPYIQPRELFSLAQKAWGDETFEVFTREPDGTRSGKLGWYRGDQLNIVSVVPGQDPYGSPLLVHVADVWMEQGRLFSDVRIMHRRHGLSLHPIFGRAVA